MTIDDIGIYLREHGIKPSLQRIKIYEYLVNNKNHPNVDRIYNDLAKEIPTLSKTTIYNTLNLFIEKKIATVITIEENEVKYDADTSFHGHFKCNNCGKIYDFDVEVKSEDQDKLKGFLISDKQVYYRGICKNCVDNN